jgi:hypothetical protein
MAHVGTPNTAINPLGGGAAAAQASRLNVSSVALDFSTETAQIIGTFPDESVIVDVLIVTTTAFNDGTGTVCDVGIDGNTDSIVDGADIQAAGTVVGTVIAAGRRISSEDVLVALQNGTDGDADEGAAIVYVTWIAPEPS